MATTQQTPQQTPKQKTLGPIERGVCYPYPDFLTRSGLGRKAIARLRREGMPVRKAGRNSFILGDDFLDALEAGK
jgi:hypothetical protein